MKPARQMGGGMGKRHREGLTTPAFHILVALAAGDRHGYAIMKDVETRTDGSVKLRPGTLYRAITRLLDEGWIDQAEAREVEVGDERRKVYRLTPAGRERARAETFRLAQMVAAARASDLVADTELS